MNKYCEPTQLAQATAVAKKTRGFQLLSKQQQRIITTSITFEKRRTRSQKEEDVYQQTHELHRSLNCHLSVLLLETGQQTWKMSNDDIPPSFFNAKYYRALIDHESQISTLFSQKNFPLVVHISEFPYQTNTHNSVHHTFLALDFVGNTLILWEKAGFNYPFQITTGNSVLHEYPSNYWGTRQLYNYHQVFRPGLIARIRNLLLPRYYLN